MTTPTFPSPQYHARGPIETGILARYAAARARLCPPIIVPPRPTPIARLLPAPATSAELTVARPAPQNVELLSELHTPVDRLIAEIADKHEITVAEMKSKRRTAKIVAARQEAFCLLVRETSMSLPMIGRKFGGFDHTTVLYGARKHAKKILCDLPSRKTYGARKEPVWGVGGWH